MSKYIGDVSAYAYAVSKGYAGTEEEFAELMADYAEVGQRAEDAADRAEAALDEFTSVTADATTLPEGSSATAEYSDGHLTLGIPKGDKGDGAYHIELSGESFVIHTDASGVAAAQEFMIYIDARQGTTKKVISRVEGLPSISTGSGTIAPEIIKHAFTGSVATIIYTIPANTQISAGQINAQYTAYINDGTTNGFGVRCSLSVAVVKDGAKGDKGDTGDKGDKGDKGDTGNTGNTPNLTIGTVTTLQPTAPATATISGTADNPVLSFGIPKGDTGEVSQDQFDAALALKADAIGNYPDLAVGTAEQIDSDTVVSEDVAPYQFRQSISGASNRAYDKIVGGTVCFNQLFNTSNYAQSTTSNGITFTNNGDGTVTANGTATARANFSLGNITVISGHVYIYGTPDTNNAERWIGNSTYGTQNGMKYMYKMIVNGLVGMNCMVASGTTLNNYVFKPQLIDLTAMFGTTIADYVYSLETATAGAGVAWLKANFPRIFNAGYVPYNAGELVSVQASAHKMTGFNQWDEEWEQGGLVDGNPSTDASRVRSKNYCECVANTAYYRHCGKGAGINIFWYDADKNYISYEAGTSTAVVTSPANARYFKICTTTAYGGTYLNDICINISSSRNGEYEPYEAHSYPLDDSIELRGLPKLDADNNLVYDGDVYESDGKVTRKYGIVDLGTLNWTRNADTNGGYYFICNVISTMKKQADNYAVWSNLVIGKAYSNVASATIALGTASNLTYGGHDSGAIRIKDDAYSDVATFKTAMSGVMLVYELATPTTESAQPFTNPQVVDASGTEEYVTDSVVPVGHVTKYVENLKAKLESAPASPTEDGDYIVRQTDGVNEYVPLEDAPAITAKADVTDLLKAFPVDTASGAIASFSDGAELPLKSLTVDIEPIQDGTGDPSPDNVRPISGHTQAVVTRTGVNVWDEEWESGNYDANGLPVANASTIRSKNFIPVVSDTVYFMKTPSVQNRICFYDANKNFITRSDLRRSDAEFTIIEGCHYIKFHIDGNTYNHDISVNSPSTDHDYHPYSGQSINIALGQTVYGGKLDVTKGELVIDSAMRTLTGADDWILDSDGTSKDGVTCLRAYQEMSALKKPVGNEGNRTYIGVIIASNLPTVKNGYVNQLNMDGIDMAITGYAGDKGNYLYIIVNKSTMSIRTVADLKAWLAENNVQFCYELATPITVTLTPNELSTLLGANNIWSDAGEVTAEYRADPTLFIQRKIADALS